jgi:hypothetical protein
MKYTPAMLLTNSGSSWVAEHGHLTLIREKPDRYLPKLIIAGLRQLTFGTDILTML